MQNPDHWSARHLHLLVDVSQIDNLCSGGHCRNQCRKERKEKKKEGRKCHITITYLAVPALFSLPLPECYGELLTAEDDPLCVQVSVVPASPVFLWNPFLFPPKTQIYSVTLSQRLRSLCLDLVFPVSRWLIEFLTQGVGWRTHVRFTLQAMNILKKCFRVWLL